MSWLRRPGIGGCREHVLAGKAPYAQESDGVRRAALSDPPPLSDDIPDRGLGLPPAREGRPSGETGGHTVQDWEQPPPLRGLSNPRERQSSDPGDLASGSFDEPSPATIPLYLRPSATTLLADPVAATPDPEARARILTAQSTAIVDNLTRGLAEALAVSLRPIVASTVVALLPMMLSLGSIPEDEWPDAARPTRKTASALP